MVSKTITEVFVQSTTALSKTDEPKKNAKISIPKGAKKKVCARFSVNF
jgi:hypothetical protein